MLWSDPLHLLLQPLYMDSILHVEKYGWQLSITRILNVCQHWLVTYIVERNYEWKSAKQSHDRKMSRKIIEIRNNVFH